MKLDPVKFKEHLARMRRDREMELAKLKGELVDAGVHRFEILEQNEETLEREINLLAELYAAVEDSMEPSE